MELKALYSLLLACRAENRFRILIYEDQFLKRLVKLQHWDLEIWSRRRQYNICLIFVDMEVA